MSQPRSRWSAPNAVAVNRKTNTIYVAAPLQPEAKRSGSHSRERDRTGFSRHTIVLITAVIAGLAPAGAATQAAAAAGAAASPGTWGTAIEVPGTAALNQGGDAAVEAVSCASTGNCTAGRYYSDSFGHQPFVAREINGRWGTAKQVPGIAALTQGGSAVIHSLSCGSAGNCSAAGSYFDAATHNDQAFVVSESNGTWHAAKQVAAALNLGGIAEVTSVSCASAGNCSAGRSYADAAGHTQAFAVGETSGTWHAAKQVPGTAALNQGGAPSSSRCRARRRATAAPPGSTQPTTIFSRCSWPARRTAPGAPP